MSYLTKIQKVAGIMDSVNASFIPSSKASPLQHRQSQPSSSSWSGSLQKTNESLIIIFCISFIILASLITVTVILFHMHNHNYNLTSDPPKSIKPNSAKLETFCSETQDPELCFTFISTSIKETETDPDDIFAVSIKVAVDNIISLAQLMREVLLISNMTGTESALEHCTGSFTESLKHLKWSLTSILLGRKENYRVFSSHVPVDMGMKSLTYDRRRELMTWLIRAMGALDTCVDVLDEAGSAAVDELISVKLYQARVQVCNTGDFLLHRDKIKE